MLIGAYEYNMNINQKPINDIITKKVMLSGPELPEVLHATFLGPAIFIVSSSFPLLYLP